MSLNRYYRLQTVKVEQFYLDAPVEIEKGALLLDRQTSSVILQLLLNVLQGSCSDISSVTVQIDGKDDIGEKIPDLAPKLYVFRDVYLTEQNSFGEQIPIVLDERIREVSVAITRVAFRNQQVWQPKGSELKIPPQASVTSLNRELTEQLSRDQEKLYHQKRNAIRYLPMQADGYWVCTCGRPNADAHESCGRCGWDRQLIFKLLAAEELQRRLAEYQFEKEQIEEKRRLEEEAHHQEILRRKKQIRKTVLVGLTICLLLLVARFYILPPVLYEYAKNQADTGNYTKAIEAFRYLVDYRDSKQLIKNTILEEVRVLLIEENYEESLRLLNEIDGYWGSEELRIVASYGYGKQKIAEGDCASAIKYLAGLNYSDSAEVLGNCVYFDLNFSKEDYHINDVFIFYVTFHSISNERVIINSVWSLPGGRIYRQSKVLTSGIQDSFYYYYPMSEKRDSSLAGIAKLQLFNGETNDLIGEYEFTISN